MHQQPSPIHTTIHTICDVVGVVQKRGQSANELKTQVNPKVILKLMSALSNNHHPSIPKKKKQRKNNTVSSIYSRLSKRFHHNCAYEVVVSAQPVLRMLTASCEICMYMVLF